ncbi:hypothetical protein RJ55_08105 [Drechmeria coniospora]|nr:hypothetical protein RJ55_08105 [Drechmeria coniospora]
MLSSLRRFVTTSSRSRMALYNPTTTTTTAAAAAVAPAGAAAHGQAPQFTRATLAKRDLDQASPIPQFHAWFTAAQEEHAAAAASGCPTPETCTLSTARLPDGRVSSRLVYLKELDARGTFVVYSNLATSRKAEDLRSNPNVALVFYWAPLQRQVRVEGRALRCTAAESQAYFATRVRGSRIGAWASRQSEVLQPSGDDGDDGRRQLDGWVADVEKRFEGTEDIPVPDFWGGLRIEPTRIEFWQGRDSRLHDRFVYEREKDEGGDSKCKWRLERLSP